MLPATARRHAWLGLVMAGVLSAATSARAQEDHPAWVSDPDVLEDEARAHFRIGRSLYDGGRFREAAAEFETAYRLSRRPKLLFNVYVAHREAGAAARAIGALRSFLQQTPNAPDRVNLRARLDAMESAYRRQHPEAARPLPRSPDASPPPSEPPPTSLGAQERPRTSTDAAARGRSSPWPWLVVGAGGAMLLTGTLTGLLVLNRETELEQRCPGGACAVPFQGYRDQSRRFAVLTDALLIAGGAAVVGGLVWWLLDREAPTERAASASAGCDPQGCSATYRMAF